MKPKQVKCPRCGTLSDYIPSNEFRPFCSQRCKLIDLGAWASEEYRVADHATQLPNNEDQENIFQ